MLTNTKPTCVSRRLAFKLSGVAATPSDAAAKEKPSGGQDDVLKPSGGQDDVLVEVQEAISCRPPAPSVKHFERRPATWQRLRLVSLPGGAHETAKPFIDAVELALL